MRKLLAAGTLALMLGGTFLMGATPAGADTVTTKITTPFEVEMVPGMLCYQTRTVIIEGQPVVLLLPVSICQAVYVSPSQNITLTIAP